MKSYVACSCVENDCGEAVSDVYHTHVYHTHVILGTMAFQSRLEIRIITEETPKTKYKSHSCSCVVFLCLKFKYKVKQTATAKTFDEIHEWVTSMKKLRPYFGQASRKLVAKGKKLEGMTLRRVTNANLKIKNTRFTYTRFQKTLYHQHAVFLSSAGLCIQQHGTY